MRSFASDSNPGVRPAVMETLTRANQDHALDYGDDSRIKEAVQKIREMFVADCESLFVFNGTDNNVITLQLLTRPYNSIICAETAHAHVDKCDPPVKMTGCQIRPVATPNGKLTPELITPYLHGLGDQHYSQPGAVYLLEYMELGIIYTPGELRATISLAYQHGMRVHTDGVCIVNACATLNPLLKTLTVDCGTDVFNFDGTGSRLMMGEYVIVFDDLLKAEVRFVREQSAQLASKTCYLSYQFTVYLVEKLWLKNAMCVNATAKCLYEALKQIPGVRFTRKVGSSQLLLTVPRTEIDRMLRSCFLYFQDEEVDGIRLVTSSGATKKDVDTLTRVLKGQNCIQ